jgi:hypothetical protein
VNSFQLTTIWVLSLAGAIGIVWLSIWAAMRPRRGRTLGLSREHPYRINSPFVEVCIGDGYSLSELRRLFESIRDDPKLPTDALLLFDSSARREKLADADVRERLAVFLDIMRLRMAPAYAVVVSPTIAGAAETAQVEAAVAGVRVGLFQDFDRARRWLSRYSPVAASHSRAYCVDGNV